VADSVDAVFRAAWDAHWLSTIQPDLFVIRFPSTIPAQAVMRLVAGPAMADPLARQIA
jgi:hypothetical protein